jgi:hypothetical protein
MLVQPGSILTIQLVLDRNRILKSATEVKSGGKDESGKLVFKSNVQGKFTRMQSNLNIQKRNLNSEEKTNAK